MNFGNETETFEERHRYFFQNCSYRFEGLDRTTRLGFESIIVRLSGTIDKQSKYCLTEKSYFEREDNKNRDDLYSIIYIKDCLDACDILDIKPYRFLTNKNVQDCQCSIAKHILRADSCERYYFNNLCCPSCDDLNSLSDGFKNIFSVSATDIPNLYQARKVKDEDVLNLLSEKKKKYEIERVIQSSKFTRIDDQQTLDYSSCEYHSYDEAFYTCYSSSDSELNEDSTLSIEILSRDKSVSNKNQEAEKDTANCIENNMAVDADSKTSSSKESKKDMFQNAKSSVDVDSEDSSSNESVSNANNESIESEKSVSTKNQGAEKDTVKCIENNMTVDADSKASSSKESEKDMFQNAKSSVDIDSEDSSSNESISNIRKYKKNISNKRKCNIAMENSSNEKSPSFINNKTRKKTCNKAKQIIIMDGSSSDDEFEVQKCKNLEKPVRRHKKSCIVLESDDSGDDDPVFNQQLEAQQRPSCSQSNDIVVMSTSNPLNGKSQVNKDLKKFQSTRSSENIDVQHTYKWWLHLPERDENSYFVERRRTENDRRRGSSFSLNEQRQMIAYLVVNKKIPYAKSFMPWKQMLSNGYMRHRSSDSLQNHFRKTILPKIDQFGLPLEIRLQFRYLNNVY